MVDAVRAITEINDDEYVASRAAHTTLRGTVSHTTVIVPVPVELLRLVERLAPAPGDDP